MKSCNTFHACRLSNFLSWVSFCVTSIKGHTFLFLDYISLREFLKSGNREKLNYSWKCTKLIVTSEVLNCTAKMLSINKRSIVRTYFKCNTFKWRLVYVDNTWNNSCQVTFVETSDRGGKCKPTKEKEKLDGTSTLGIIIVELPIACVNMHTIA